MNEVIPAKKDEMIACMSRRASVLKRIIAHCIVQPKVCCGPIRQVADHHAIRLSPMLMQHHNVCEIVVSAGLHKL